MILSAFILALLMTLVGLVFAFIIHLLFASIPATISAIMGLLLSFGVFYFLGWWFFGRKKQ